MSWIHSASSWIRAHYEVLTILVAALNALATLAAVGVALFLQYLRERWLRPRLRVTWRQRDFTVDVDESTGEDLHLHRLQVINIGDQAAEGVEATVVDVYERHDFEHYRIIREFLPTPLRWTHVGSAIRVFLPGKASRLLDFGTFSYRPTERGTASRFKFHTEIEPVNGYNILTGGAYVVRVVVSARNARAATVLIRLGVGIHMHHDKFHHHEDDKARFSIALADKKMERFLDDGDNIFDGERPSLKTWEER